MENKKEVKEWPESMKEYIAHYNIWREIQNVLNTIPIPLIDIISEYNSVWIIYELFDSNIMGQLRLINSTKLFDLFDTESYHKIF